MTERSENPSHHPRSGPPAPTTGAGHPADLGLSGVFESEPRFLNRDGSFNAHRTGLGRRAFSAYADLLTMRWPTFFGVSLALYLLLNAFFGVLYFLLGPSALSEMPDGTAARLVACFFFSVQTFGTIGFGHVYPSTLEANVLVTMEAFVGLMGVALVTGVLFARFSRPTHRILFSHHAVIAPHPLADETPGRALMFRVMNGRRTDLLDISAEVILTLRHEPGGVALTAPRSGNKGLGNRAFYPLPLERDRVTFFPLAWTIVHSIDEHSPLYGLELPDLLRLEAELVVVLRATEEASQQNIQARSSYHASEIRSGVRFASMYVRESGQLAVDARRLHDLQSADLPLLEARPVS
ncbi:ion channel [Deinococcus oregonensis]|uniref:Ion channel n=1 Tax=Deinococcus oregonensis TaxID=1805970 RepID=A0ABV6AZW2_9DEIO